MNISIQNLTSPGTFTADQIYNAWWALRYQALYQYNRSPWVEHGYSSPVAQVILLPPGATPAPGDWNIELLDTSDQEGALGYHEDKAFDKNSPGPQKASGRSSRGLAAHNELPLAKVFCKTSREDGVQPTEVASHEMLEMLVDPQVVNEGEIRKYLNAGSKQWYIGEVGDPVQGRGYDVGAPDGRPCGVPEAGVADFAYPAWWAQTQTRRFTTAAEEFGLSPRVEAFELAPGGYMSVAPEDQPGEWTQIFGDSK
jgi:hypothetical protein